MTREEIRATIDSENGEGYSLNLNLNGYNFTKNGSFIVFELRIIDDIKICNIKYIFYKEKKDLVTIIVNCCNFWMGEGVQFIFYKEKKKKNSVVQFLKDLNFRVEATTCEKWKYNFKCNVCNSDDCKCIVHRLYK